MLEKSVEKAVCKWAKDNGISTLKLGGMHNRGKYDRIFMLNGKAVFMELKRPGLKETELQKDFGNKCRANGFSAAFFDDAGLAIRWLKKEFNV